MDRNQQLATCQNCVLMLEGVPPVVAAAGGGPHNHHGRLRQDPVLPHRSDGAPQPAMTNRVFRSSRPAGAALEGVSLDGPLAT